MHTPSNRIHRFLVRLSHLQVTRPQIPLVLAGVLTIISLTLAMKLKVLTGFESLLPDSRASVQELRRVATKTAGVSTLFIVLEGGPSTPVEALRKASDALVPELSKLGSPWVGSAESGVHEAYHYLAPRAGLFADLEKLRTLHEEVEARYAYEVGKATGTNLDDDAPPPPLDPERFKKEFGLSDEDTQRYPDGYYQSKDGKTLVVTVRSKVLGTDFDAATETLKRVREVVDRVNPSSFDPQIHYGFAGDLQTAIAEYTAIDRDLREVGLTGVLLIGSAILLYYLRFRTIFAILLTMGIGVAWTFGFTQLTIGNLNMATGFLFTIVAGNGINFAIIYMARYLEARRKGERLETAIVTAHTETLLPTLTAALAASGSYGSLIATEFRGFRDFGLVGGAGMILCWIATISTLPSILALVERHFPLERESRGLLGRIRRQTQGGIPFGRPFAWIVAKAPLPIAVFGIGLAVAGAFATYFYVKADPMEYDLQHLRNDPSARADLIRRSRLGEDITGHVGADGMAILVEKPEQVASLREALYARRDSAPPDSKPFKDVHALQDFVPPSQADKIPLLLSIKDKVVRAHRRGFVTEEQWERIKPFLPPDDLAPFGISDLPDGLARAFTETDGTRGRIVYISPVTPESADDAHYLFRWADSYRETRLPDGSTIYGSGRAVIYADMWASIIGEVPRAVSLSFAMTVIVVCFAFRKGRATLSVLGALLVGVGWMCGLLVLMNVKLNFLNFIALPITFGIGVDYAVNVVQRYVREGRGGALTAVRETGGAVVLCSLTTSLGYLALVRSQNFAVRSLGIAAVLGEVACQLAAVLVLPAFLVYVDRKKVAAEELSTSGV